MKLLKPAAISLSGIANVSVFTYVLSLNELMMTRITGRTQMMLISENTMERMTSPRFCALNDLAITAVPPSFWCS